MAEEEDSISIPRDPKENFPPLQIAAKRVRRSFVRNAYARVITIREMDKDRGTSRITKIPASLQDARASMLITASKLMKRLESKLDRLEDSDAHVTTKEYKDMMETFERSMEMMTSAFGEGAANQKGATGAPVNHGLIINGAASADISRLMSQVANAATKKSPAIDIASNDAGTAQPNP